MNAHLLVLMKTEGHLLKLVYQDNDAYEKLISNNKHVDVKTSRRLLLTVLVTLMHTILFRQLITFVKESFSNSPQM